MIRRRIVLLYWILALTILSPIVSYAYIDPATTTYIIQIITALVITLGVTLSIALYKMKMLIMNLRILFYDLRHRFFSKKVREEARIEKEAQELNGEKNEEGVRYGIPRPRSEYPGVVPLPEDEEPASEPEKKKGLLGVIHFLFNDERTFRKRLLISSLVAATLPFTVIVFGIFDLVISNQDVIIFSYKEIAEKVFQLAIGYFVVLAACLIIWRGKVFDVIISFVLGLSVAAYLQGTFLNINLGQLTGDTINWDEYLVHNIMNLIIWVAIIIAILALRFFSIKIWTKACIFLPAIIITVQLVALISIIPSDVTTEPAHPKVPPHVVSRIADDLGEKTNGKPMPPHEIIEAKYGKLSQGEEYSLTTEGIYDVSSKDNVFIFILDRLDLRYVNQVLQHDPSFFDSLDGFTMFTNNISHYSRTFPSVASTLTGRLHMFDVPATTYFTEAYHDSEFIPDIQDAGFRSKLYMERPYTFSSTDQLFSLADNIGGIKFEVRPFYPYPRLQNLSKYRYAPGLFKQNYFVSPHSFGKMRRTKSSSGIEPYRTDDVKFYDNLMSNGLTVTKDDGNFVVYHLQGPHTPFSMTEDIKRVKDGKSNVVSQTMGSFRIIYEFINQLKQLGLYEDATIIITGDHGKSFNFNRLDHAIRTGLYVKQSGSAETPLGYSNAPVNPDNLRPTIIQAVGGDHESYGRTYFEVPEDDDVVRKYYYRVDKTDEHGPILEEFEVKGDSSSFSNWKKVRDIEIDYWYG